VWQAIVIILLVCILLGLRRYLRNRRNLLIHQFLHNASQSHTNRLCICIDYTEPNYLSLIERTSNEYSRLKPLVLFNGPIWKAKSTSKKLPDDYELLWVEDSRTLTRLGIFYMPYYFVLDIDGRVVKEGKLFA